jgi:hypothetical protein
MLSSAVHPVCYAVLSSAAASDVCDWESPGACMLAIAGDPGLDPAQLDCAQQLMQNNAGKGGCTELGLQPAFENALRHAIKLLLPFALTLL